MSTIFGSRESDLAIAIGISTLTPSKMYRYLASTEPPTFLTSPSTDARVLGLN